MAKRKVARRRRQPKSMFNLVTLGKSIFTLNAATRYFAGANLQEFVMGQTYGSQSAGYGNYLSGDRLSLAEMLGIFQVAGAKNTPVFEQVKKNMNRQGALQQFVVENIAIQVVPEFLKRAGINKSFNQLSKQLGMKKFVKMGGN